ncbi:pyridoxal-phosphate dependent enzyme [Chryseolinea sp. H1M3-3]|uniref:1-aminocyclopropane-1-carboxylate deaminase/D-cysteine desulfhydrase n=1 Tax=Chryseolinea sp. H1M3-3 TaxID=3034144 RepID=UPI0023ED12CB|nr:pyridoxal-phosphate dependent enzyme [Chryseolinea sp. H1M3-3]
MLHYRDTPVQKIHDEVLERAQVSLLIKREDLNHPYVSGNKWWKLKYNIKDAVDNNFKTLVTFGGAYSNHIFATAAAASEVNLKSVGIIRGERTLPLNPTLSFAEQKGMKLYFIPREAYREKKIPERLLDELEDPYVIPEGGSNLWAVKGVRDFADTLKCEYDYLCCPVGTGGTLAGLIEQVNVRKIILGFPVLKQADFLINEILNLSKKSKDATNWRLMYDYHFGGYAKTTSQLLEFIERFKLLHNIPLEFVYTAKMMMGVYDLIGKNFFKPGSTILAIHTGGLQLQNGSPE